MNVYFNGKHVVSFEGRVDAETIKAKVGAKIPAIKTANYELSPDGETIYFNKEARKLG